MRRFTGYIKISIDGGVRAEAYDEISIPGRDKRKGGERLFESKAGLSVRHS